MCNKGDLASPDCRARFVACEIHTYDDAAFFAATSPLEAKRVLFSQFATERTRGGQPLKLHFSDARMAYFNGRPNRSLYLRLPRELGLPSTTLGKLVRCCYGTRDAGSIWEAFYVSSLTSMGFLQGRASPCCFYHPTWQVHVVVHGDDFTALGTDSALDTYEKELMRCFDVKLRGRLGEGPEDLREIRVLNRIVRVDSTGLVYEADPRHSELLVRSLGLEDTRFISTPGVRWNEDLEPGPQQNEDILDPAMVPQEEIELDHIVAPVSQCRRPQSRIVERCVQGAGNQRFMHGTRGS